MRKNIMPPKLEYYNYWDAWLNYNLASRLETLQYLPCRSFSTKRAQNNSEEYRNEQFQDITEEVKF